MLFVSLHRLVNIFLCIITPSNVMLLHKLHHFKDDIFTYYYTIFLCNVLTYDYAILNIMSYV